MKTRLHKKNGSAQKLTARESAFLKHIESGMTITSAARSAGYSQKWPGQAGAQAFRNIKKKRPEILDDLGLTVEALLRRLKATKFDGSPYYICGHTVMLRMLQAVKREINSKELVAFIFDRQQEYAAGMMGIHSRLTLPECEFHSQVGSITFDDKQRFIPLQVADTLAYEVRKDQEYRLLTPDAPERPEFSRLKAEGKIFQISLCERECLEWYLEH